MKIGIYGYGNLGRGAEIAIRDSDDAELVGIFTRRDPRSVVTETGARIYRAEEAENFADKIDVLLVCGGSAGDLPTLTPMLASVFNVVDSFDTHADISGHLARTDEAARKSDNLALVSAGWDPGLFSVARLAFSSFLPHGKTHTFWGKGVSQGHSDAVRQIDGVKDAREYTVPIEQTVLRVESGDTREFDAREMHRREVYVVAEDGADILRIDREIKEMPNYFMPYETSVSFISEEKMKAEHSALPHGGRVIGTGKTGKNSDHMQTAEYRLDLSSNPEFTASVLVACARAVFRMKKRGETGAITMLDICPADLSPLSRNEMIKKIM